MSSFNRRFIGDVTFLFNVISRHYDINISNELIFGNDTGGKMTHRTVLQILVELMVLNIASLTVLLMNGMVYLIILENQIVFQLLKGMF